jgi:hypothetical protein
MLLIVFSGAEFVPDGARGGQKQLIDADRMETGDFEGVLEPDILCLQH